MRREKAQVRQQKDEADAYAAAVEELGALKTRRALYQLFHTGQRLDQLRTQAEELRSEGARLAQAIAAAEAEAARVKKRKAVVGRGVAGARTKLAKARPKRRKGAR